MASIEYRSRTARVVTYIGKKKTRFALGRVTKKTAERFANNIDDLIYTHRCNLSMSREVRNWLEGLTDELFDVLADVGLVEPRAESPCLEEFVEAYITGRTDVTERRRGKLRNAKRRLVEYFGNVDMTTITPGAADEYSRWLLENLAPATAQKECQVAAQFFRHAERRELIDRNPFDGVTVGTATNEERHVFVDRETVDRVLEACSDWQWRATVALARYGGLRCSSEVALLKWSDVCWDSNRFTVTSPKTERYGKASRVVPLFPELLPYLEEAFDKADVGATWVIPRLGGNTTKNLGTTFKKIIGRAGVEVWPKPFQNLRSSRQTELEQRYPTYVVCRWMGNTPKIADKHYLQVTESHFEAAVAGDKRGTIGDKRGTQPPAPSRTVSRTASRKPLEIRDNASFSEVVALFENALVAEEGLEPPTRGL